MAAAAGLRASSNRGGRQAASCRGPPALRPGERAAAKLVLTVSGQAGDAPDDLAGAQACMLMLPKLVAKGVPRPGVVEILFSVSRISRGLCRSDLGR